ncbi:sialate O-acetylesterase [Hyunsoonleella sp. SJ7]|uniref:Sialate O-acetylesterase n=1 Tax=Hyunsoonleella aquatilis TaxID=2762758 RepID=A0A923HFX5_9FLAO|nr:sialate O-acetylesterase [Hyunsoonleella aquatilis]MBC3758655.1 sialate O-acetylesterase [Hyunsoonleella aquatilis]
MFFILCALSMQGQTKLPAVFGDNMVLQQNENVSIWGKDSPGTKIEIRSSWGIKTNAIANPNGFWETSIKTKKASFKTEELEIKGSTTITLRNILIGEVWFCSGQSNMEMPLKGLRKSKVLNAEKYLQKSDNIYIRLFNNARTASVSPSFDVNGKWQESSRESAFSFSAIGYIFGTRLFEKLNVPIGIIESSWGGTKIESWIPKSYLLKYDGIKFSDSLPKEQNKQKKPTFLYNAMTHPFKNFKVKGMLWYQGESNRSEPESYYGYMKDLIASWRSQWQNENLPFYFVQIAPYDYTKHRKSQGIKANLIREAQLKIAQEIKNTGIVVTTDAGDCNDIHPSKKEIIAKRLVNWALTEQYHRTGLYYRSPEYRSMEIKNNKVILSFHFDKNDSFVLTEKVNGFAIAGKDKVFHDADVVFGSDGRTLVLKNKNITNPEAVRYGFEDCFENDLKTKSGLPMSVFRTDNW